MDNTPPDRRIDGESSRAAAVAPPAVPHTAWGPRRVSPRAGLLPRVPLSSAELIKAGVRPELLASLALRRASTGRVAKLGGHYFDYGHPMPSYLTGTFDELVETGLLALAEEDPGGLRRVTLTPAGHARYAQPSVPPGNP
ncbi:MAG: hypothetical protein ACRDS0_04540 [Pseudonocardiaceae bacterium]